jgi:predicted phosphodiesterase
MIEFAAVSDIHGNLPALEAVIDHIAAQGITRIVNLGDSLRGRYGRVKRRKD